MRLPRFIVAIALLGTPVATVASTATSVAADPFTYTAVSVSHRGACALTPDGVVVCWGDNPDRYVFADRPAGAVPTPTRIPLPNGQKWKSINVGDAYANCGLSESDRAWCWGNHHIGSYFTTTSRVPVEVEFPRDVRLREVQSGASTACATTTSRELWCWGDAHYLGDGSIEPVRIPVRIPMPDNSTIASFNMGVHGICAVTSTQKMYCWGDNSDGQLGLGYAQQFPYSFSWTPVLIPAPAGEIWAMPSVGLGRICAITVSGAGYCAGDNYNGAFGDGTYSDSTRFQKMQVPNNERLTAIESGWYHTCVSTESNTLWCFGRGDYGELGTGTTLGGRTWRSPLVPQDVTFTSFSAGIAGTCGLETTGRVWCWGGLNWGSQGTGRINATLFPEVIAPVGSPSILDTTVSSIDAERVTVNSRVNPNGYNTTIAVEVSESSSFATSTRHAVAVPLPDNSYASRAFSLSLTSLAPRTTYYARVIATNTLGITTGSPTSFITLGEEPSVGPVSVADITGNEASLVVTLHPNRLTTTALIEFSRDRLFSTGVTHIAIESFSGNSPIDRSENIRSLQPNTTYFARAIATNRLGTTVGDISEFSTIGSRPTVAITATSATLTSVSVSATLTTGLVRGVAYLELSTTSTFDSIIRSHSQSFDSRGPTEYSFSLFGLTARTQYWARVIATNDVGSASSAIAPQRTRGAIPAVRITSLVTRTHSATAHLIFDSTGLHTFVKVQVSKNADMSNATEYFVSALAADSETHTSTTFQDLSPRTTYYVTATASNEAGITRTATSQFITETPIGIVINNDDDETSSTTVTVSVSPPASAVAYRIANNAAFRNAQVFVPSSPISWELTASDQPTAARTVYVQVYLANGQFLVYEDTITLITNVDVPDNDAPVIETLRSVRSSTATATASSSSRTKAVSAFTITTRDRRSGVTRIEMKVGNRTIVTKVDATRRGSYTVALPRGAKVVRVRLRDAAGNYSAWKKFTVN